MDEPATLIHTAQDPTADKRDENVVAVYAMAHGARRVRSGNGRCSIGPDIDRYRRLLQPV